MTRVTVVGLALAMSAGPTLAADLGAGRERSGRELRLEQARPHRAMPALKVVQVRRQGPPYPVNWRGYPQSR